MLTVLTMLTPCPQKSASVTPSAAGAESATAAADNAPPHVAQKPVHATLEHRLDEEIQYGADEQPHKRQRIELVFSPVISTAPSEVASTTPTIASFVNSPTKAVSPIASNTSVGVRKPRAPLVFRRKSPLPSPRKSSCTKLRLIKVKSIFKEHPKAKRRSCASFFFPSRFINLTHALPSFRYGLLATQLSSFSSPCYL